MSFFEGTIDVGAVMWNGKTDYKAWERGEIAKAKKGIRIAIWYSPKQEATQPQITHLVKHGLNVVRFALVEMVHSGEVIARVDREWGLPTTYRLAKPYIDAEVLDG